MTAQELLFSAYTQGISITADGSGNLRIAPAHLVNPRLIADIKAHKRELLALVTDLEQQGALTDPLILEALALFNAKPKGLVKSASVPFLAFVRLPVTLGVAGNAAASHTPQQATFQKE
jgi:hypothetical protein